MRENSRSNLLCVCPTNRNTTVMIVNGVSSKARNIQFKKPKHKLMCVLLWHVVRAKVELSRQAPLPHRHHVHIHEYGGALHLRTVFAIIEDRARVMCCVSRPEPHGSNRARDQSLLLVLDNMCRQPAPYGKHAVFAWSIFSINMRHFAPPPHHSVPALLSIFTHPC